MARAVRSGTRVDTALLVGCALLALLMTVLPLNMRDAIASGLRRTVVAPLVQLQEQAERGRSAFLSREATNRRVDSLALRAMQLAALEQENLRLRRLLGLGRALDFGFVVSEALHAESPGQRNMLTLTVGTNAGVTKGSPVVAPEGAVGIVQTADPSSSLVIMWTHPDFRVSAMSADGSTFGIVSAHEAGSDTDQPDRFLLELRGVAFRSALERNTLIVSSGFGGVWPRGVPIGTVLGELRTSEGWARTYLLRPAVRPPDVSHVMVLLPERTQTSVEAVWRSARAADSAARRIVEAGDSVARRDSLEEAARRTRADSARAPIVRDTAAARPTAADSARLRARADSLRRRTPGAVPPDTAPRRPQP